MPPSTADLPTDLIHDGRPVRLKWHKLKLAAGDPPFARRNLTAGLAAGASLEVDIRPLACGRFVCLHDPLLEDETTGQGAVAEADAAAVAGLRMLGSNGEAPLLLDELVRMASAGPAAPSALVQLDLHVSAAEIDGAAVAAFAAALNGAGERFILSGGDWDAVTRLGGGVAGLALGYDPTDDAGEASTDAILRLVGDRAPDADTIYLYRKTIRAAHERGDDLVARLRGRGHRVDCWTIDHGDDEATADLMAALATGCDQITTNTPRAWATAMSEAKEAGIG